MPFTFSHPAIVLPFSRIKSNYISVSSLVVGSVTPDFEYFLTMKLTGRFSHTVTGAFVFDLPVALILVFIFHLIVKKPLINSLPTYFHSRLITLRDFDFLARFRRYFPGYLLCLLMGIFSHLVWDSFTHSNEHMVQLFPVLLQPVDVSMLPSWPLFRYFQHISTLVGAVVIIYFFHYQPSNPSVSNTFDFRYGIGIVVLALIAFLIRWAVGFEYFGDVVATIISSLALGTVVVSSVYLIFSSKHYS
jgi:hypothetical protein